MRIAVSDNGRNSAKHLRRVTRAILCASNAAAAAIGRHGLGLAIVKHIASATKARSTSAARWAKHASDRRLRVRRDWRCHKSVTHCPRWSQKAG